MHYYTSADLQAAQPWLSGCVGYLFQREEPPQRSFYYLIKLTELPQNARMAFLTGISRPATRSAGTQICRSFSVSWRSSA